MRRLLSILLILALLGLPALAEETARVEDCAVLPGGAPEIHYYLFQPAAASLILTDGNGQQLTEILAKRNLVAGHHILRLEAGYFDGLAPGSYTLLLSGEGIEARGTLTLGTQSAPEAAATAAPTETPVPAAAETITPALRSAARPGHTACYWCTPMDITDEAAVWAMLTAPITVVNIDQKSQAILYAEPNPDSEGIGVVTGASQAVHVLENRSDGWSLVEAYSSSFHDSKVKNWNAFVTGYIQTGKLKQITVNQEYGIVIDKLTQRLYLFHDGSLMTTLKVSTGLYNERQPYNETRSGEFIIISRVGDFKSDELICGMGLRFNSGDLLHEVPHTLNADETKNYKKLEAKLGARASHGCIRVQRMRNAENINMRWIWENIKVGTKLVVWEDYQGRKITPPADDTVLYYNPEGNSHYHDTATSVGVKNQYLPLTAFTYGELDSGIFADFTPCPYCAMVLRKSEIEKINQEHMTASPGEIMAILGE